VGTQIIEPQLDWNAAGLAEAFQYTATSSGVATRLVIYLDASSAATRVVLGLYADSANDPGALLAQGTISSPVKGAWNTATIVPTSINAGATYWIAVLGPTGAGTVRFRDVGAGGRSQVSAQTTLTALPGTWSRGILYSNAPMSAYAAP
jgi:hypothetical protein